MLNYNHIIYYNRCWQRPASVWCAQICIMFSCIVAVVAAAVAAAVVVVIIVVLLSL